MIGLSDEAKAALGGSFTLQVRAEAWLGGTLLADDVPVHSGAEESDLALAVPERITLTVPRLDRGTSWAPVDAGDPLAAFGQRLRVSLGIGIGNQVTEWVQRGEFLIRSARVNGDQVDVEAVGLLALIDEARFVSPFQPSGTLASTLRALVEPALTVVIDGDLADRSVPSGMAWDEDRLAAVHELVDAWPADARVTADGYLEVRPASAGDPVLALTDGDGGTVVLADGDSARDGGYSAVVARGQASDGTQVQGVAYDTSAGSPTRHGGPFNPLPVPYFHYSPLLTTSTQARKSAETMLRRLKRASAAGLHVTAVPHIGLEAGDTVTLTTEQHGTTTAAVEALTLPYTADAGPMRLTARVVAS